ncbi:hypothetical protein MWU75_18850 [Ornithinimicrobium sp. F0845]|uniref:hypothetical protein n=1 Tax=Ornithinimicrobium sp. F0845 TaxID=2926412 RepID=UPI001FF5E4F1|nr:hypothetical protein [Ornithinimicrobium sp. F0845]MCK0114202.1 hypothetical protein [Ornithinimicrobium sp. F0845]
MLTKNRRFGFFIALTAGLTLTITACSGDTPGTEPAEAQPEPAAAAEENESDVDSGDVDSGDEDSGDEDSVYGGDLDTLGTALQAGTGADSFSVDGTTVRLHFGVGSVEDPSAHINCSAAGHLLEDGHQAVMVYPDGEKNCSAEDSAGSPGDGANGVGSASLTIGDSSWEFSQLVCAFGEEETGVEGSEFNLLASDGSATVYAAIDPGYTYIEFTEPAAADPSLSELITGIEPTIEISGKNIYADASFITYEDTDTLHVGALKATCP